MHELVSSDFFNHSLLLGFKLNINFVDVFFSYFLVFGSVVEEVFCRLFSSSLNLRKRICNVSGTKLQVVHRVFTLLAFGLFFDMDFCFGFLCLLEGISLLLFLVI